MRLAILVSAILLAEVIGGPSLKLSGGVIGMVIAVALLSILGDALDILDYF